ncbi:MAG: TPM domain-containing protein [Lachnospiraceae bacterium]|nr:TPM domain-containing protein [Lachnospiraceae bacterium]
MQAEKTFEKNIFAKLLLIPAVCAICLIFGVSPVHAYDALYENPDTGYKAYLIDEEDLLSDDEEGMLLEEYMIPITEYGGVSFVSTSTHGGEATARDYCYKLFNNGSGTTLCIDMGDRLISVMSSGAIYSRINNNYGSIITDNIYTYATKENYFGCAAEGFSEIYTILSGGRIAQPMKYISNFLLALVLGLLLNFIYVWVKKGKVSAEDIAIITAAAGVAIGTNVAKTLVHSKKTRHQSSGGSSGGGGGGGGGGGFSGGGGSHGF